MTASETNVRRDVARARELSSVGVYTRGADEVLLIR